MGRVELSRKVGRVEPAPLAQLSRTVDTCYAVVNPVKTL
jgi:hypothetical protein